MKILINSVLTHGNFHLETNPLFLLERKRQNWWKLMHVYIPFSKRPSSIPNHSLIHCVTSSKWLKLSWTSMSSVRH